MYKIHLNLILFILNRREKLNMNLNKLARKGVAAMAMAFAAAVAPVQAAPVISVNLSTTNIALGGTLGVDINVSGLTGALGAYDFTLNFNGTLLSFNNLLSDPDTKMGDALNPAVDLGLGNVGNTVDFLVLAGFTSAADEAVLAGIQGAGFTMGRVELDAIGLGLASLTITDFSLSDYSGATIADVTARGAQVCVSRDGQTPCDNQVPEPMTAWLVGIALGGLALTGRRQRKAV
jgi:hypothetical protein